MSANAGRTAPIGPTDPYAFEAGSQQRTEIAKALTEIRDADWQFASTVDGQELRTGNVQNVVAPHNHSHVLGQVDFGGAEQAQAAVDASVKNARWWVHCPGRSGWRRSCVPPTCSSTGRGARSSTQPRCWSCRRPPTRLTLTQPVRQSISFAPTSRTCSTCMTCSRARNRARGTAWNTAPSRASLFAVTPFNFTCMNNLAFAPAIQGNTVVWKPAESASLVAHLSMQLLQEAGLPDGVINVVYGGGAAIGPTVLDNPHLAAVHFTGSTGTFQHLWRTVGENVNRYRNYPRVVGETGGKA